MTEQEDPFDAAINLFRQQVNIEGEMIVLDDEDDASGIILQAAKNFMERHPDQVPYLVAGLIRLSMIIDDGY
jgi:hypothetical protein